MFDTSDRLLNEGESNTSSLELITSGFLGTSLVAIVAYGTWAAMQGLWP